MLPPDDSLPRVLYVEGVRCGHELEWHLVRWLITTNWHESAWLHRERPPRAAGRWESVREGNTFSRSCGSSRGPVALKAWYSQKWNRDWPGPGYQPVEFVAVAELIRDYEQELGEAKFYESLSPILRRFFHETLDQLQQLDGPVAARRHDFGSARAASEHVKQFAKRLGIDIVGICALDPAFIYRGHTCPHPYAIALGMKMDPTQLKEVPFSSNYESLRVYAALGRATVALAAHLRELGYPARAHHPRGPAGASLVNHVPVAVRAGLGELGRHGSVISPVLGSWLRLGTVTTDLSLTPDAPLTGAIVDFCTSCTLCAQHCPGDAISRGPMQLANGVLRWVVDTEQCVPYFRNLGSCAICIQVCPWNAKAADAGLKQEYLRDTPRWKGLHGASYRTLPVLERTAASNPSS